MGRVSRHIKGIPPLVINLKHGTRTFQYVSKPIILACVYMSLCRFAIISSRIYICSKNLPFSDIILLLCEGTAAGIHKVPYISVPSTTRFAHVHAFEKQKMRKTKT